MRMRVLSLVGVLSLVLGLSGVKFAYSSSEHRRANGGISLNSQVDQWPDPDDPPRPPASQPTNQR
jgi:hypothetical protein